MQRRIAALLSLLVLAACAAPPPPPAAFTGPVAQLSMTEIARGPFAANVAYVAKINGQDFQGSIYPSQPPPDTPLSPVTGTITTVNIPAGPGTYSVVGHSIFQAPIVQLAMSEYCIWGDIHFTPVANSNYVLHGIFTPGYSALWIEDAATSIVQGNKIEVHGSAIVGKFSNSTSEGDAKACDPPTAFGIFAIR